MANEIQNISHAGIVCSFDVIPVAPVIQAAWGLDETAGITREVAAGPGVYSIPLTQPIGARTGPGGETVSLGGILSAAVFFSGGNRLDVSLVRSDFAVPPPFNADIQLSLLLFLIIDGAGTPADAPMVCNVNVWRVPTQD